MSFPAPKYKEKATPDIDIKRQNAKGVHCTYNWKRQNETINLPRKSQDLPSNPHCRIFYEKVFRITFLRVRWSLGRS